MHETVEEVLPRVEEEDGDKELEGRDGHVVEEAGDGHLPGSKGGDDDVGCAGGGEEGIVASGESSSEEGVRGGEVLGDGRGVEAEQAEEAREGALQQAQAGGPNGDVVVVLARHLRGLSQGEKGAGGNLDDLLNNDVAGDVVSRDMVALCDFLGGVQSVLGEEVEGVDDVEEDGDDPVDGDGGDEVEPKVGDPGEDVALGLKGVFGQRWQAGVEEGVVGSHGFQAGGRDVCHAGPRWVLLWLPLEGRARDANE